MRAKLIHSTTQHLIIFYFLLILFIHLKKFLNELKLFLVDAHFLKILFIDKSIKILFEVFNFMIFCKYKMPFSS